MPSSSSRHALPNRSFRLTVPDLVIARCAGTRAVNDASVTATTSRHVIKPLGETSHLQRRIVVDVCQSSGHNAAVPSENGRHIEFCDLHLASEMVCCRLERGEHAEMVTRACRRVADAPCHPA
jgi:hypothetical protein